MNINFLNPNQNSLHFRAIHGTLFSSSNANNNPERPYLNHTTKFMRYDTDELIMKLCARQFCEEPLNILSVGCSYGEEVYSYAMGFDVLGKEAKIIGVDISQDAISEAKKGRYFLDLGESDLFLFGRNSNEFKSKVAQKFKENFSTDKTLFEFVKKPNSYTNCSFTCASALDIGEICEKNSQDLISCKNVLYHLTLSDKQEFITKAYNALKPGGYLYIKSDEDEQDFDMYQSTGFFQPFPRDYPFILQKPYDFKW